MKNNNNKEKRFRQVKIINPLPLNKMIATSITKWSRKTRFTTNYGTAEEGMFHINYKTAEEGMFHINYKIVVGDLIYN